LHRSFEKVKRPGLTQRNGDEILIGPDLGSEVHESIVNVTDTPPLTEWSIQTGSEERRQQLYASSQNRVGLSSMSLLASRT
jgi:hypothetical protein